MRFKIDPKSTKIRSWKFKFDFGGQKLADFRGQENDFRGQEGGFGGQESDFGGQKGEEYFGMLFFWRGRWNGGGPLARVQRVELELLPISHAVASLADAADDGKRALRVLGVGLSPLRAKIEGGLGM